MNRALRVAACQYQVGPIAAWDAFEKKLDLVLGEARRGGADLALLPEYFTMELATMFAAAVRESLPKQLEALQPWIRKYRLYLTDRAKRFRMGIVGGSIPVRDEDGRYRNRCFIATADGREHVQDKRRMTRFEHEQWGISGGNGHALFEVKGVKCAVAICYDSEFPNDVREKIDLGAELILVPSCTDSLAGYHRVRVGSQARALENQCYVAVSYTVGDLPQSPRHRRESRCRCRLRPARSRLPRRRCRRPGPARRGAMGLRRPRLRQDRYGASRWSGVEPSGLVVVLSQRFAATVTQRDSARPWSSTTRMS